MGEKLKTKEPQFKTFLGNFFYTARWVSGCIVGAPLVLAYYASDRGVRTARLVLSVLILACLLVPTSIGVHLGIQWARQDTILREVWQPTLATLDDIEPERPGDAYYLWYSYRPPNSEKNYHLLKPLKQGAHKGDQITIWVSATNPEDIYLEDPSWMWPNSSPDTPIASGSIGFFLGLLTIGWATWSYLQAKLARRANRRLAAERTE
jgi:hypothetical protein